jgi:hypothetical protein
VREERRGRLQLRQKKHKNDFALVPLFSGKLLKVEKHLNHITLMPGHLLTVFFVIRKICFYRDSANEVGAFARWEEHCQQVMTIVSSFEKFGMGTRKRWLKATKNNRWKNLFLARQVQSGEVCVNLSSAYYSECWWEKIEGNSRVGDAFWLLFATLSRLTSCAKAFYTCRD